MEWKKILCRESPRTLLWPSESANGLEGLPHFCPLRQKRGDFIYSSWRTFAVGDLSRLQAKVSLNFTGKSSPIPVRGRAAGSPG